MKKTNTRNIPFEIVNEGDTYTRTEHLDGVEEATVVYDATDPELEELLKKVGNYFKEKFILWKKEAYEKYYPILVNTRLPWAKLGVIAVLVFVCLKDDMNFNMALRSPLSLFSGVEHSQLTAKARPTKNELAPVSSAQLNIKRTKDFIQEYKQVAVDEMKLFGVPASIKMAQAIIESRAGRSRLALESQNFFGIKCRRKCKGCTCRNYHDDDVYDMFRVFESSWESWREHSKLLSLPRYKKLQAHGKDYKKWAHGLKAAGYATDKRYAEKLIGVIQKYKLYELDEL